MECLGWAAHAYGYSVDEEIDTRVTTYLQSYIFYILFSHRLSCFFVFLYDWTGLFMHGAPSTKYTTLNIYEW